MQTRRRLTFHAIKAIRPFFLEQSFLFARPRTRFIDLRASKMADDTAVFRFADLPAELKVKVYEQYFVGTELQLCHFDDKKDNFYFSGMPSLALELTGKAICAESRMVRARLISTTILVTEESFVEKTMVKLVSSQKYAWIRNHIRRLKLGLVHSKRPENQRKTARS